MKRAFFAVILCIAVPIAVFAAESPAATPTPGDEAPKALVLEDGTPVNLVLEENVSSADAVTGQTVAFETVDDIVVNGFIVIPRGSTAWATVTDAEHKRRMGRAGHVDMNIDKVRLADGEKALLRAVKNSQGGSNTGKMVGAMAATAIFTLGGSALFLLAHGKDTTIPKGTNVSAFIQGNVTLDQSKFQRQPLLGSQVKTVAQDSSVGPVAVAPMRHAQPVTASPERQEAPYAETAQQAHERAARNTVVFSENSSEESFGEQAKHAKQRTECLKLAADNPSIICK